MHDYASTDAQRGAVAGCLDELTAALLRVQDAIRETLPSGIVRIESSRNVNAAARIVGLNAVVATDYLRSIAGLLTLPGSHGPSVAAIERSLLETWGRAWWVMDAPTATRAEYRARAMVVTELQAGARRGIRMLSTESIVDAISRAERERDAIKILAKENVPSRTDLVKNVLAACGWHDDAAAVYSHLSGVAHGESVFTESLIEMPPSMPLPVIALPSDNLGKYSRTVFGVTFIGASRLIETWGVPDSVRDLFLGEAVDIGRRLETALSGHT